MGEVKQTPKKEYLNVIKHTNLISIDLIIFDKENRVLVGKRKNNPAIGMYFVPGSRVYKSEKIKDAISRVCNFELGFVLENPEFRGVYEHIYDNNFDNDNFGTHYVNFAYGFHITNDTKNSINNSVFSEQHSDYKWMSINELLESKDVEYYCKTHFMDKPENMVV